MTKQIDTNEMRRKVGPSDYDGNDVFALCDEIDRLRGVQTPPQGKTVAVRVAASVSPDGEWVACGGSNVPMDDVLSYCEHDPGEGDILYWLTATLPVPQEVEVVAEVEDATR